jgi:peroxiredoxin
MRGITAQHAPRRSEETAMNPHAPLAPILDSTRLPRVGEPAPWVDGIISQTGRPMDLRKLRGHKVLLLFHPCEYAPPCPVEGYDFLKRLGISGVAIFGIGLDDVDSHMLYAQHHGHLFDLLLDPEHRLARAYGIMPKEDGHPFRSSFLIGRKGGIAHVWIDPDQDRFWHEVRDLTRPSRTSGERSPSQR